MSQAFVCGCKGLSLSADERAFLKDADPIGVILFKRNIDAPDQVRALTGEIRSALGRDEAWILVDQEGGRVQRVGPPNWRRYPAAAKFGLVANAAERADLVRSAARLMAVDLMSLGIDVSCLPVLDVPVEGAHDVIGDRAYARDPAAVAEFGRAAALGTLAAGVLPVMKHVPGHGRAGADSHFALPRVDASLISLRESDFVPFRANRDLPAAMSAHVVYEAVDADWPATISAKVICDIVRGEIGFDGLLFSDDLSMKALPGTFRDKAYGLFAASVDIALHCNGDLAEAAEVAAVAPAVSGACLRRVEAARAAVGAAMRDAEAFDPVDTALRLDRLLSAAA